MFYEANLENDADFISIIESAAKIGEFIDDSLTEIHTDVNLSVLKQKISATDQKSSQIEVLSDLTNRPEVLYDLLEEKYAYQRAFINNNPEFQQLSTAQQEELIENVVLSNFSVSLEKQTPCTDQLESDLSYCHARQYTAAAFCGLMAPTLGGALLCGAAVVVDSGICHDQAYANWDLCMEATY